MEIKVEQILEFNNDYKPATRPPREAGYYMTIRCGLTGIYYAPNEWKDGEWQHHILDGSFVVAYSKEAIAKKAMDEWALQKIREKEANSKWKEKAL